MEIRSYGDEDGYWTFKGPVQLHPGNGTFYDSTFPDGTVSAFKEDSITQGLPQITDEEIVLIRLSW